MTTKTDEKTILIKGDPVYNELAMTSGEAMLPGHLVERISAGTLSKHSGAGLTSTRAFALENENDGGGIDDAYANGETVKFATCRPGDVVNAILADGETVAIGEYLESNGDGTLREVDADAATAQDERNSLVGIALEAQSPSGSTARILVEVI